MSASQVEAARKVHGLNLLPQPRPVRWPNRLLRSLRSPLILLLVVAAVLAWLSGHHTDSLAIAAVLVVNAAVGAWHEGRAERSMSALRHWDEVVVRVRRDHHDVDVPARELVPGDVVLLTAGDAVAADARLWQAARLQVSEAALTGESVPVPKDIGTVEPDTAPAGQSGMVFSGTFVTSGTATALVVATGSRSEFGRIAALAQTTRPPETPLEYRTRRFGRFLAMGAVLACAAVVFLGVLRRHPLEDISLLALGQLVSLVPEGLPVAVTIALAAGMQRMASHGALVRNLAAVETIGEATVVCTDKTGTLTRNEMTVHQAWVPSGRIFVADGTGYDPAGSVRTSDGKPAGDDPELLALAEGGLLCSDADLSSPTVPEGDWRIDGDPTEGALVVFAAKVGLDPDGHRQAHPRDAERPFDPEKQRMATRHRSPDGAVRVFVKGSPEALLLLLGDPDSPVAASARAAAETMAGDGLRVLAVGVVAGDPWAHRVSGDLLAGHVHLLGLVGQIDRPRPEVPGALRACQLAGIRVVMVTGDHLRTASAIAGEVGMLGQQDQAVDGTELSRWDDPTLDARIGSVAVFSRVSPGQKLRIVDAFQRRGELVAMTGDGVNDGPALARADVGVAMGTGGTDVARACADIVLVDNRFATLVEGIRQGRVVGENLRRVLLFVVSTSVDEVILVLLSLATGLPAPLTAVQILWVNLVTEATLTLNLVMDPPDEDVLARPPLPRNRPLVDRSMAWRIARMAASALAVCFVWFSSRILSGADLPSARAETFLLLVLCQWFHLLSAQSSTESALRIPWRTRPWLAGGLALSVLLQAGAMALEPLPKVLGTASFDPARLPWLIGAASVVLWIEEGRKAWNRRRNRPSGSPERPVSGTG